MESKNFLKLSVAGAYLLLGGFFSACSNNSDLYDPNYANEQKQNEYTDNWAKTIGAINPAQDWNVFANRQFSVNINLGTTDEYTVKVYDRDPETSNGTAQVIAETNAKGDATTTFKVNLPLGMNKVFLGCTNISGMAIIQPVTLNNNSFTASFGTATRAMTRAGITTSSLEDQTDFKEYVGDIVNTIHQSLPEGGKNKKAESTDYSFISQGLPIYVNTIYGSESWEDEVGYYTLKNGVKKQYKLINNTQSNTEIGNRVELLWKNATYHYLSGGWNTKTEDCTVPFSIKSDYSQYFKDTFNGKVSISGSLNYYTVSGIPNILSKGFIINEPAGTLVIFYIKHDKNTYTSLKGWNADKREHSAVIKTTYNNADYTFVGMEDWGDKNSDYDCNDIIFEVKGAPVIKNITETEYQYTYAFEDLGNTNDIDFNDVVLNVSYIQKITTQNNSNNVTTEIKFGKVWLMAAGGTLDTHVIYKDANGKEHDLFGEIHQKLGVATTDMVNTGAGKSAIPVATDALTGVTISAIPSDILTADVSSGFYIKVTDTKGTVSTVNMPAGTVGKAPQGLVVPNTWKWPKEKVNIKDAYSLFSDFSATRAPLDWYNTAVENNVMSVAIPQ